MLRNYMSIRLSKWLMKVKAQIVVQVLILVLAILREHTKNESYLLVCLLDQING